MKKFISACALLLVFAQAYSQVTMLTDKKKVLDAFRATETVFVLPDLYDAKTYDDIIKSSWTITPYKLVKFTDFKLADYLDGKHSFAMINLRHISRNESRYVSGMDKDALPNALYTRFSIYMYDNNDKLDEIKKFEKMPEKKKADYDIYKYSQIKILDVLLFPTYEFHLSFSDNYLKEENESINKVRNFSYTNKAFFNFTPGFLKNYLQNANSLITAGVVQDVGSGCISDVKNLKKNTLYVPEYIRENSNPRFLTTERTDEESKRMFKEYSYKYETIDAKELSDKILSNEEFYYLQFAWENGSQYFNIINSKTGEVVYKNRYFFTDKFKSGHIKDLKKAINTGKI